MNKKVFWLRLFLFTSAFIIGFIVSEHYYRQHAADKEKNTLHVYTWSDYIDSEIIQEFENANGCTICIDTFDDNESMLAKMLAGAKGYDIIFPSSYIIPVLKRHNLIQPIDMEHLPNVKANFDDKYRESLHEDSFVYSVPYAFSMTGIAFRNDKVELDEQQKKGIFAWDFLTTDNMRGKTCIMNDIREMIGVGLKMNGYSINSTNEDEIVKATTSAIAIKKIARRLDSVEYRVGLVNGSFTAAMAYSSDVFQMVQENPEVPITFVIPKEGGNASWDEMCLTSFSDKIELAHKFIDFLYQQEIAAKNIEYIGAAMPNKALDTLVPEDIKNNPLVNVPMDILNRVEVIKDVGDYISLYNKAWDSVISTKN